MKTECELNWKMIFYDWKVNLKVNPGHPARKRRWKRWNYRSTNESLVIKRLISAFVKKSQETFVKLSTTFITPAQTDLNILNFG